MLARASKGDEAFMRRHAGVVGSKDRTRPRMNRGLGVRSAGTGRVAAGLSDLLLKDFDVPTTQRPAANRQRRKAGEDFQARGRRPMVSWARWLGVGLFFVSGISALPAHGQAPEVAAKASAGHAARMAAP